MTTSKFDALKTLFATAGSLIWVTCGSKEDNPYSYMMMGLTNTAKTEQPALNAQMWDLDIHAGGIQPTTASDLAETLLRQVVMHTWGTTADNLLWTIEPQVFVENGKHLITRLVPDVEKNRRYNSQRRDVFATATLDNETLQLLGTGNGDERALELQRVSPLRLAHVPATNYRTVRLTHSVLQSVAVAAAGFFRLCTAVDFMTGERVLALCGSSDSPANVPEQWCIGLDKTLEVSTLLAVAANILAEQILSLAPKGGTLLVNEPDSALQSALQVKANCKHVHVVFTTSELKGTTTGDASAVFLHPNFPQHVIQSIIPTSTAVFVHFSRGARSNAVREAIVKYLPAACLHINEDALLSHEVNTFCETDLTELLQGALNDAQSIGLDLDACESIAVANAREHIVIGEPLAAVDWLASEKVTVAIQPIDSGTLFRDDKTYLFVGIAGELGQSLARWMIGHGARYLVLTSRTPRVNPSFIEEMKTRYGAVVKTVSLDITSRDSLLSSYAAINATLPPIAGVINGAMILEDELFANMSLNSFDRVIKPKVTGTTLLDELFYDDTTLEFFIVASSIASVIGWSGQRNYSAANEYMTSLANQRRKRGVAGLAINIPAVLGVGYAAHSDSFDFDYFASLGYINISEEDLHCLVAEAVLSGRPGQHADVKAQVVMGVNYVPADLQVKEAHRRDVKFSQFIARGEAGGRVAAVTAGVRVRVQLQAAKSADEAYAVTCEAFTARLKKILRIPEGEKIEDGVTLVEHGVDSLVAVDIRAWFLWEMKVDVPTLKILSGGSIGDLVRTALEKIPADLMQNHEGSLEAEKPGPSEGIALLTPPSEGTPALTPTRVGSDEGDSHSDIATPFDREPQDVEDLGSPTRSKLVGESGHDEAPILQD